jgi:hypothetical protein
MGDIFQVSPRVSPRSAPSPSLHVATMEQGREGKYSAGFGSGVNLGGGGVMSFVCVGKFGDQAMSP